MGHCLCKSRCSGRGKAGSSDLAVFGMTSLVYLFLLINKLMSFRTAFSREEPAFHGGLVLSHQLPSLFVFFQAHALGFAVGIEAEHGRGHAGLDGEHVPEVERDDMRDEEINIVGAIDGASFADGVSGPSFI